MASMPRSFSEIPAGPQTYVVTYLKFLQMLDASIPDGDYFFDQGARRERGMARHVERAARGAGTREGGGVGVETKREKKKQEKINKAEDLEEYATIKPSILASDDDSSSSESELEDSNLGDTKAEEGQEGSAPRVEEPAASPVDKSGDLKLGDRVALHKKVTRAQHRLDVAANVGKTVESEVTFGRFLSQYWPKMQQSSSSVGGGGHGGGHGGGSSSSSHSSSAGMVANPHVVFKEFLLIKGQLPKANQLPSSDEKPKELLRKMKQIQQQGAGAALTYEKYLDFGTQQRIWREWFRPQPLTKEEYVNGGHAAVGKESLLAAEADRGRLYQLFLKYEKEKEKREEWDMCDAIVQVNFLGGLRLILRERTLDTSWTIWSHY